jgi:hypothetical protein
MPGVAFFFESPETDVFSGRHRDLDAWNYAARAAGDVDRFRVINRTDLQVQPVDADLDFQVVAEPLELAGRVAHIVCPWDEADERIALWDFDHDVDWYAFGPAAGWRKKVGLGVYIPIAGNAALHAVHAASVVLTHRYKVIHDS